MAAFSLFPVFSLFSHAQEKLNFKHMGAVRRRRRRRVSVLVQRLWLLTLFIFTWRIVYSLKVSLQPNLPPGTLPPQFYSNFDTFKFHGISWNDEVVNLSLKASQLWILLSHVLQLCFESEWKGGTTQEFKLDLRGSGDQNRSGFVVFTVEDHVCCSLGEILWICFLGKSEWK